MEPTSEQIELSYHYEEIAMHVNTLLVQYRMELMAGIGACRVTLGFVDAAGQTFVDRDGTEIVNEVSVTLSARRIR